MNTQNEITSMVNFVMNCSHCRPLSGCIMSDLKGKQKSEVQVHFHGLSEQALQRIASYHQFCPYRERLVM